MKRFSVLSILLVAVSFSCTQMEKSWRQSTERMQGFVSLFNGENLDGWQGAKSEYGVKDGVLYSKEGCHGNLFTEKEYSDFILRFDYKLRPGGNNGIGVRCPLEGTPAFTGMEVQLLDDSYPEYQKFIPVQFNGGIYGAVAAERGHMNPVGQWNSMEIMANGPHVKVTLNGAVILDTDLREVGTPEIHNYKLTGLLREKGYIAICGHEHYVEFRDLRIKELD